MHLTVLHEQFKIRPSTKTAYVVINLLLLYHGLLYGLMFIYQNVDKYTNLNQWYHGLSSNYHDFTSNHSIVKI